MGLGHQNILARMWKFFGLVKKNDSNTQASSPSFIGLNHASRLDWMEILCKDLEERLKIRVSNCKVQPHLAVLIVGDDPASHVYVKNKIRSCERLGIKSRTLSCLQTQHKKKLKKQSFL